MIRLLLLTALTSSSLRADSLSELDAQVKPLLERYCFDCHDASVKKADLDMETTCTTPSSKLDLRFWAKVNEQVRLKAMPPKDKKNQPSDAERQLIEKWIAGAEQTVLATPPTDPGLHPVRRLTRHEYANSLHDLLGVSPATFEARFPNDGAGGEGFDNNADTLIIPALYIEKYLACADEALTQAFANPETKARLVPAPADPKTCLQAFATRAYRRPVAPEEVNDLVVIFDRARQRQVAPDAALRLAMKAALMSPKFLLLGERGESTGQPRRLAGHEMASRLSYFLWSTMPDDELTRLAAEGKLSVDAVVALQVRRMMADPRGAAFVQHFAGQWLRLEDLYEVADPDRGKFKAMTDSLMKAMHDEVLAFSDGILRHNGRVLDFLDSDYGYANEELANFYGWPGVKGQGMQRVKLPNAQRGGVLGMAAILTVTAYPQRTSPVLRGKWVLEQILGTPAPPPPAAVAKLPEDDRNLKDQTFRQILEHHRSKPECMGCHVRMDPPGFGLENFDAVGHWRDQENGKPLDASGVMPDGRTFTGPAELRKILIADQDKFARSFCARLLGYALGRGLEVADQPTLLRLEATLKKQDWHFEPLLQAVATSFPFTHLR